MSYTPTLWTTGDVITATKLNKIEEGIANAGGMVIQITRLQDDSGNICNKTWLEIYNALRTVPVTAVIIEADGDYDQLTPSFIDSVYNYEDEYVVIIAEIEYTTSSADGYPQHTSE